MSLALSTLISRMNIYTPVFIIDETRKVNALDQAIRSLRVLVSPPWVLQKALLRLFTDIYNYPVPLTFARLAILDSVKDNVNLGDRPRYIYTSLAEFIADPDYRNRMAEIWEGGVKSLGVKNKTLADATSNTADPATSVVGWTDSGDAGTLTVSDAITYNGVGVIEVPIIFSSGVAEVSATLPNALTVERFRRNYFFVPIYLGGSVDSLRLKFGLDSGNYYLSSLITTQFSGQPFLLNDWNIVAVDLNVASPIGAPGIAFDYQSVILNGAQTGTYYIGPSTMRGWVEQQFWFYSLNNVVNPDGSFQAYFSPDGATYDVNSQLIGDDVWFDMIWLDAALTLLSDQKETTIYAQVQAQQQKAAAAFYMQYPDLEPKMITEVYKFTDDYQRIMGFGVNNFVN